MADAETRPPSPANRLQIILIYALFTVIWMLVSDRLIHALAPTRHFMTTLQVLANLTYLLLSASLLYHLLRLPGQALISATHWRPWQSYALAVTVTLTTVLFRSTLGQPFEGHLLVSLYFFPVLLSAMLGGFGPCLLSATLSLAGILLLLPPPCHPVGLAG